jgi:hypothetical protein
VAACALPASAMRGSTHARAGDADASKNDARVFPQGCAIFRAPAFTIFAFIRET